MLDLYRGRVSLRRIHVLLKRLLNMPGRSALAAAVDESAQWTVTDHLLAEAADRIEIGAWVTAQAHSEKAVPVPEPISRPGQHDEQPPEPEDRMFASPYEVAEFLAGLNK